MTRDVGQEMVLTPMGKRAEKRLERLMERRDRFVDKNGTHLTGLTGADTRDRLDEQIDAIEGRFAEGGAPYYRLVKAHPRRGTRGVRSHPRLVEPYVNARKRALRAAGDPDRVLGGR